MKHTDPIDPIGDGDDEARLERLLQAAGPRLAPPPDVAAEVRAAVAAEWQAAVRSRQAQRERHTRTRWFAAAASVAAVAVGAALLAPRLLAPTDLATVARLEGPVEVRHAGATWQALGAAGVLREGDELRTSATGRVALRRPDGLELRLDTQSSIALADADVARLERGRIYVDAGRPGSGADAFVVDTPLGQVRHLGTQYSVALQPGAIEVRVREGSVAIEGPPEPVVARAGESVNVARARVTRGAIDSHGDAWAWSESVAPGFAIEGRSLDEFLAWAARETGRQLVYASPEAARAAESTQLKGSVEGLMPEAAVAAVLATTPSLQHRFAGSQLRIEPAAQ